MSRLVRHLAFCLVALALLTPHDASAVDVTDLPIAQTLTFAQLAAPVDVVRDNLGIPHVYASNLNDAAFVLGYIHASERMFQMDVFRRIPSGTVSEILGFPDFQVGASNPTDPPFPGNIVPVARIINPMYNAYAKLLPYAKTYFNNDIIATAVVIGGTFIGTLIIVSVITVKFSDMVLDSRVGALDRTLGFLFGLARGLVIVVVAVLLLVVGAGRRSVRAACVIFAVCSMISVFITPSRGVWQSTTLPWRASMNAYSAIRRQAASVTILSVSTTPGTTSCSSPE